MATEREGGKPWHRLATPHEPASRMPHAEVAAHTTLRVLFIILFELLHGVLQVLLVKFGVRVIVFAGNFNRFFIVLH